MNSRCPPKNTRVTERTETTDHARFSRKQRLQRLSRHGLWRTRWAIMVHGILAPDGIPVLFALALIPAGWSAATAVAPGLCPLYVSSGIDVLEGNPCKRSSPAWVRPQSGCGPSLAKRSAL